MLLNSCKALHHLLVELDCSNEILRILFKELIVAWILGWELQCLEDLGLLIQEAFDLGLRSPCVKNILVLDLLFLSHKAPQDQLIVFEVEEFHAEVK